jgi:hypothetical protein
MRGVLGMRQRAHAMPGTGNSPMGWPLPDRLTVNAVDRGDVPDVLLMCGALHGGNRADS